MSEVPKEVIVVGVDGSEQSVYALEWTFEHLLAPFEGEEEVHCPYTIFLVHARPTAASVLQGHRAAPGAVDNLPRMVERDLREIGDRAIRNARSICSRRDFRDIHWEVMEGDARNVLCAAVERHNASVLVVGSHGYGAINRAVLGSVSDYCADHARCSLIIVKRPNI